MTFSSMCKQAALATALLGSIMAAGCTQGVGDRCQITSDCDDGLTCNEATNTCQSSLAGIDGSISPDATKIVDASVPDAKPVDAAATIDAAAAIDANATPDAAGV